MHKMNWNLNEKEAFFLFLRGAKTVNVNGIIVIIRVAPLGLNALSGWDFQCCLLPLPQKQPSSKCLSPDVLGLKLPEAFTVSRAAQDFWEL